MLVVSTSDGTYQVFGAQTTQDRDFRVTRQFTMPCTGQVQVAWVPAFIQPTPETDPPAQEDPAEVCGTCGPTVAGIYRTNTLSSFIVDQIDVRPLLDVSSVPGSGADPIPPLDYMNLQCGTVFTWFGLA